MTEAWDAEFVRRSPMFAAVGRAAHFFAECTHWPGLTAYNAMARELDLRNAQGLSLSFVAAAPKPRGSRRRQAAQATKLPYEAQVYHHGEVPTRLGNWHDFFNALVWATFPHAKAALNERQMQTALQDKGRGREQDRLAMFDEGGIILLPEAGGKSQGLVFGHALFEAFMHGQTAVYGMTYVSTQAASFTSSLSLAKLNEIDFEFAQYVGAGLMWNPDQRPPRSLLSDLKFVTMGV